VSHKVLNEQTAQGLPLEHPCYPRNFEGIYDGRPFVGLGDFDRCANAVQSFLATARDFKSVDIHTISATNQFVGVVEFYYANKILKLPPNSTLAQLKEAASELCRTNWSDLDLGDEQPFVNTSCWDPVYQWVLLTQAFHFVDEKTVISKLDEINGTKVSWTLGAMLERMAPLEIKKEQRLKVSYVVYLLLLLLLPVFFCWQRRRGHKKEKVNG
jgi:hypothetical protein